MPSAQRTHPTSVLRAMRVARGIEDVYLVGVFSRGVTIRKQQVRALNLVWALTKAGRLTEKSKVAVIGGGFAGITAAAALLTRKPRELYLFERRAVLCPLQQGCDTRWVHPHVYDWPALGALRPIAGLPIMNWREGRASDVAHHLLARWNAYRDFARDRSSQVVEVLQARHIKLQGRKVQWIGVVDTGTHSNRGTPVGDDKEFDVVVIAVGFGVEHAPEGLEAVSYWRNETFNQPELSDRRRSVLVSGTGDGGLIDLLRVRLVQFRLDTVIDETFGGLAHAKMRIKEIYNRHKKRPSNRLFDDFARLPDLDQLIDRVRHRLRGDTEATLQIQGSKSIRGIFESDASFLNRLLVFLLYRAGGFTLRFGRLESSACSGFDHVIVRHGTDRTSHLESLFVSPKEGQRCLRLAQQRQHAAPADDVLAPAGWWDRMDTDKATWQQEYAPAATISLATGFVSGLHAVLGSAQRFRATLHRAVEVSRTPFLQQIAYYCGSRKRGGAPYRAFPATRGLIGLCYRTARAWRSWQAKDMSDAAFYKALADDMRTLSLESGGAQAMDADVRSLFVAPLVYAHSGRRKLVVAVLFVDSSASNVFTDAVCANLIRALAGFGKLLDRVAKSGIGELQPVRQSIRQATAMQPPKLRSVQPVSFRPPSTRLDSLDVEWSGRLHEVH